MADLTTSIAIKILDAFTGPLRNMETGLGNVEQRAGRLRKAMAFSADLNQAAEGMGRFANGIMGPVRGAVNEFAEFDHALSRLSAMGGEDARRGSAGFEMMKKQASDLGAATEYSAREVVELQTEYLKAGFSLNEAAGVTEQTLAAAAAEGIGLSEASAIVAGALRGMGLEVSETARVTDVLAAMSVKSKASMQSLSEGLSYAAGPASQLGLSIERTAAMLGVLHNNNIEGTRSGTAMNAVLKGIVRKPGRDELDAWQKLHITTKDLQEMRANLTRDKPELAFQRMAQALKGLSQDKQVQLLQRLFGDEGAAAAGFLIRASVDVKSGGLAALSKEADTAKGKTLEMAKIMREDLMGAMERAGGAVAALNNAAGEALAPAASSTADVVETAAGALQDFIKENPRFSKATLELTAGMGTVALGLQGMLTAASAWNSGTAYTLKAFEKLNGSLIGRAGLVGAAGAAGYAIGTWVEQTFDIANRLNRMIGLRETNEGEDLTGAVRTYAGGWKVNHKTGEVVAMGTGEGPAEVRRARAAGAATQAEMTAVLGLQARNAASRPFQVAAGARAPGSGGMLAAQAQDAATRASPLAKPGVTDEATRQQTVLLLEELRKQTRIAEERARQDAAMAARLSWAGAGVPQM